MGFLMFPVCVILRLLRLDDLVVILFFQKLFKNACFKNFPQTNTNLHLFARASSLVGYHNGSALMSAAAAVAADGELAQRDATHVSLRELGPRLLL